MPAAMAAWVSQTAGVADAGDAGVGDYGDALADGEGVDELGGAIALVVLMQLTVGVAI